MHQATPPRRRIARVGRIAGVLACLLVLLGPTGAAQAQDPSKNLLGNSPMCAEAECDSGVSWRPYDRSHYGLDEWSDPGITDVPEVGNYLIHLVVGWIWQGALWIMDGILMLLEWAFSLTLINDDTLPKLASGLEDMHENLFGTSWFLAALGILGLWGLYHGLVRARTIQTLGGLAGAVLLMCCALIIIENPKGTIGEFTDFVNDGALGILALGASGSTDNAEETYQNTSERLFELVITDPWCALQFASVNFCKMKDNDEDILVKDAWLRWEANSDEDDRSQCKVNCPPGGDEGSRGEEYEALKAAAKENQEGYSMARVEYMEGDGAIARMGLLLLILAGLVGAGALFFFLALQLIAAGVMTLLLVMATPVMLFAPAFGETGRKAFGTWAKRLAGAVVAKLVYALFLAIVIFCANIITSMGPPDDLAPGEESGALSWGALWLVFTVFWWTVLTKRDQMLGFVTGNQPGGFGLLKAALGMKLAKDAIGGAVGKATYLPRKGAGALWKRRGHPTGAYRKRRKEKRQGEDKTAREEVMDGRGGLRERAEHQAQRDRSDASQTLQNDKEWRDHEIAVRNTKQGQPTPPRPSVSQPTQAEVQAARNTINRHGAHGKITITDADVETYVKQHGNHIDEEDFEKSRQAGGMSRKEIKEVRELNRDEFDRKVTVERKRTRRVRRTEEKSKRRDRLYR